MSTCPAPHGNHPTSPPPRPPRDVALTDGNDKSVLAGVLATSQTWRAQPLRDAARLRDHAGRGDRRALAWQRLGRWRVTIVAAREDGKRRAGIWRSYGPAAGGRRV